VKKVSLFSRLFLFFFLFSFDSPPSFGEEVEVMTDSLLPPPPSVSFFFLPEAGLRATR